MFISSLMNAWEAGTIVALASGLVGFFVVVRGDVFAAHAIPNTAFTGVSAAYLFGLSADGILDPGRAIAGLAICAAIGAVLISLLGRHVRQDVATALVLVLLLGLGDLFLSRISGFADVLFGYLFGNLYGVSGAEMLPLAVIELAAVILIFLISRPLLLTSVLPQGAENSYVRQAVDMLFLVSVALATSMAVPVVGALLMFALLVAPPAMASLLTKRPATALAVSVILALVMIWASIALSVELNAPTGLPVGFCLGALSTVGYAIVKAGSVIAARLRPAATLDLPEFPEGMIVG